MPSFTNVIDIDLSEAASDYKVESHKAVHQWDQGVVLNFTGVIIPEGTTCQFDGKTSTYNFIVEDSSTQIPNVVLAEDMNGDVKAHLHIATEEYGIVIYDIHIPVIRRVKPAHYVSMDNITGLAVAGIPAAPTTDGTYNLRCTVSSGVATYSWVSTS
jgi:hypothetical protein